MCSLLSNLTLRADLPYHPIRFGLSTDKEIYYEGEKITFYITITNSSKETPYPVLLPHTQNTGPKLFCLNAYDKAANYHVLRYTEDPMLRMMVHDTGSVKIHYLQPLEEIVVPIYLNDFENYFNYHTQNSSHHSFGVPLFAGIYQINVSYRPMGLALGDSLYNYYHDTHNDFPSNGKLAMPGDGDLSNTITLKIRRSADTIVSIERKNYYIKSDGHRYYYFSEPMDQIVTDLRCIHITSLPPDSFTQARGEYFYSHFTDLFAEYVGWFDDGDLREYRKWTDYCPDDLFTLRFNAFKQKTFFAQQLADGRWYEADYHQPGGKLHREQYCSKDGTLCHEIRYEYNKDGTLRRTRMVPVAPCIETMLDGKMRSLHRVDELGG